MKNVGRVIRGKYGPLLCFTTYCEDEYYKSRITTASQLTICMPPIAQVFAQMEDHAVAPDVVTCCSLITAFETGGRWDLSLQMLCQMSAALSPLRETALKLGQVKCVYLTISKTPSRDCLEAKPGQMTPLFHLSQNQHTLPTRDMRQVEQGNLHLQHSFA